MHLRFVEDLTYAEIATRVRLSVTHVARLTGRALARLQAVAAAGEEAALTPGSAAAARVSPGYGSQRLSP